MNRKLKAAFAEREKKKQAALQRLTATQERFKPNNLKAEISRRAQQKAAAIGRASLDSAKRHRTKIIFGTVAASIAATGIMFYRPIKGRLSNYMSSEK